tara:strand:+ start:7272 stop:8447 length:1176 start_codon:yes stop_codon:yes gene_type:complete
MSRDLDYYKDDDGDFEYLYLTEANALAVITYVQGLSDDELKTFAESFFTNFNGKSLGNADDKDAITDNLLDFLDIEISKVNNDRLANETINKAFKDADGNAFNNADFSRYAANNLLNAVIDFEEPVYDVADVEEEAALRAGQEPTLGYIYDEETNERVRQTERDVRQILSELTDDELIDFAMELAYHGLYGKDNYDAVFLRGEDEGEYELDYAAFDQAVNNAIRLATRFGPDLQQFTDPQGLLPDQFTGGFDVPLFFNILARVQTDETGLSSDEIRTLFTQERAATRRNDAFRMIDQVSVFNAMETAAVNLLGRKATKREKDIFMEMIFDLQLSENAPVNINLAARAGDAITEGDLGRDVTQRYQARESVNAAEQVVNVIRSLGGSARGNV